MHRRALVTGAAGYVGRAIAIDLAARGYQVVATDRLPVALSDPRIEERIGDLLDASFVDTLFATPYTLVVHSAAAVPLASRDPADYARINIGTTRLVARGSRSSDFLVMIGSSAVWGRPNEIVTRSTPYAPFEAYGRSKLEAERVLAEELAGAAAGFAIIRPRTIVGAGRGGIFAVLIRWIRAGLPIPLADTGRGRLGLVGIDDLVALVTFLGERKITGIWPAAAPAVRPLAEEIGALIGRAGSTSFTFSVPGWAIRSVGGLLHLVGLSPFRPWHLGGWADPEFVIDERWRPDGFTYRQTNGELLQRLLDEQSVSGSSPHRSALATPTIDRLLRLLRPFARLRRIR